MKKYFLIIIFILLSCHLRAHSGDVVLPSGNRELIALVSAANESDDFVRDIFAKRISPNKINKWFARADYEIITIEESGYREFGFMKRASNVFYTERANFDTIEGIFNIAACLLVKYKGNEKLFKKGMSLMEECASKDYDNALVYLGCICFENKDYDKALQYFERSADCGNVDSQLIVQKMRFANGAAAVSRFVGTLSSFALAGGMLFYAAGNRSNSALVTFDNHSIKDDAKTALKAERLAMLKKDLADCRIENMKDSANDTNEHVITIANGITYYARYDGSKWRVSLPAEDILDIGKNIIMGFLAPTMDPGELFTTPTLEGAKQEILKCEQKRITEMIAKFDN